MTYNTFTYLKLVPALMLLISGISSGHHKYSTTPAYEDLFEEDASTIENISQLLNITDESCIRKLISSFKLQVPHLVNRTLLTTHDYYVQTFEKKANTSLESNLREAKTILNNIEKFLKYQDTYHTALKSFLGLVGYDIQNNYNCGRNSDCACFWQQLLETYQKYLDSICKNRDELRKYIILGTYTDPVFRIFIMAIGLILNGSLLFAFIFEKHLRNEYNVVIFNIVLSNILMLCVYIPVGYFYKYYNPDLLSEYVYVFIEVLTVSLNTITIATLNLQRYFDVQRVVRLHTGQWQLTSKQRVLLYIVGIWASSIAVGVLMCQIDREFVHSIEVLGYYLIYVFVLSSLLIVAYGMARWIIVWADKHEQTSSDLDFIIDCESTQALNYIFYFIHVPFFIYMAVEKYITRTYQYSPYYAPSWYRMMYVIPSVYFFIYPCANIVALYKASRTYRRCCRKYLLGIFYHTKVGEYSSLSSLNSAEELQQNVVYVKRFSETAN